MIRKVEFEELRHELLGAMGKITNVDLKTVRLLELVITTIESLCIKYNAVLSQVERVSQFLSRAAVATNKDIRALAKEILKQVRQTVLPLLDAALPNETRVRAVDVFIDAVGSLDVLLESISRAIALTYSTAITPLEEYLG